MFSSLLVVSISVELIMSIKHMTVLQIVLFVTSFSNVIPILQMGNLASNRKLATELQKAVGVLGFTPRHTVQLLAIFLFHLILFPINFSSVLFQ